jgi:hypothetical protein
MMTVEPAGAEVVVAQHTYRGVVLAAPPAGGVVDQTKLDEAADQVANHTCVHSEATGTLLIGTVKYW